MEAAKALDLNASHVANIDAAHRDDIINALDFYFTVFEGNAYEGRHVA